ncbi:MAG: SPOR domain-containing protein [Pseudomonadota bacterium]
MNKHRIVGLIVLIALAVIAAQFFISYQKTYPLQTHRSPPVAPLEEKSMSPENAPKVQSTETLMEEHFDAVPDRVVATPAWVVQIASLTNQSKAQALLDQLKSLGFDAFIFNLSGQGTSTFRICAGPFTDRSLAITALSQIQERLKMTGILKQYIPGDGTETNAQLI